MEKLVQRSGEHKHKQEPRIGCDAREAAGLIDLFVVTLIMECGAIAQISSSFSLACVGGRSNSSPHLPYLQHLTSPLSFHTSP